MAGLSKSMWVHILFLSAVISIQGQSSAQLRVYSETSLKVEPSESRWPSSFIVLSCTVEPVNATVPTRWVLPHGQIISQSFGRYWMGQGRDENQVWSTVLAVQNVSYRDAGFYTCEVVPSSISRSQCECVDFPFSATTELQLKVSIDAVEDAIFATEGVTESVQLGCEMKGFLRPDEDLLWYKEHQLLPSEGGRHLIIVKDGSLGAGQDGRNETVHSRLSVLNIKYPKVSDSGVYSCKVRGTEAEASMSVTVNKPQVKGPVTNKPNPSKGQGTGYDVTTTSSLSRGTKLDGKNERELLGDRNSNKFQGCSLGTAELVIIIGIISVTTAALSTLLTISIGCFCLKRRQQRKMSYNKQTAAPNQGDENRSHWQEESSLDSMVVSGADSILVHVGAPVQVQSRLNSKLEAAKTH